MSIVNLTPHTINEVVTGKTYPPSGQVARVAVEYHNTGRIVDGVPVFVAKYGEIEGLPGYMEGVIYVVSSMVLAACRRTDVVSPGELVRDENGKPVGCRGFKQTN